MSEDLLAPEVEPSSDDGALDGQEPEGQETPSSEVGTTDAPVVPSVEERIDELEKQIKAVGNTNITLTQELVKARDAYREAQSIADAADARARKLEEARDRETFRILDDEDYLNQRISDVGAAKALKEYRLAEKRREEVEAETTARETAKQPPTNAAPDDNAIYAQMENFALDADWTRKQFRALMGEVNWYAGQSRANAIADFQKRIAAGPVGVTKANENTLRAAEQVARRKVANQPIRGSGAPSVAGEGTSENDLYFAKLEKARKRLDGSGGSDIL